MELNDQKNFGLNFPIESNFIKDIVYHLFFFIGNHNVITL
jgi:hypothetical protein